MARPNWEYIRVDVLLPGNPKLDGLNSASKWSLIELWCHCGQYLTDGFVREAVWRRICTASASRLLVENGLAHRVSGGYQMHDYLEHQRSRAEVAELKEKRRSAGRKGGQAKASAKQVPEQVPEQVLYQNSGKPLAEAEAEAEAEVSGGPVGDQSSVRYARDDDLIDLIITELRTATGRTISRQWAEGVRSSLLNGRTVTDPAAYVRNAIRNERDPRTRFLPVASSLPSARPPGEAALAAGVTPNGTPLRGPAVAAIAAEVRQAITQEPA